MTKQPVNRYLWWWLIPLLILTTWLGARSLDADIVWVDEYHSVEDSGLLYFGPLSPAGIWERVATGNPWHAPGYFLLLNVWHRFVGETPAALRAMSLFFGLMTIAWTYRLGANLRNQRAGLFAAVILATSAFFVHFLHEMRVYTVFTFLTVFTFWVYLHIIGAKAPVGKLWWLGLLAGAVALLYVHYFAMLPLATICFYHLFFVRKDRRWWVVVGLLGLAGVLFLPWVSVLFNLFNRADDFAQLSERALSATDALAVLLYYFSNANVVLLVPLLLLALLVRGRGPRTILFWAFTLLALLLVVNQVVRVMHGGRIRYLIALWPLLALVVSLGLLRLKRWPWLQVVLLVVWSGFGLYNTLINDITRDLDGGRYVFPMHRTVRLLDNQMQEDDVIVNFLPDTGLPKLQYERIAAFYYTPIDLEYLLLQVPADPGDWAAEQNSALTLLGSRERIWLVSMPSMVPSPLLGFTAALADTHQRCDLPFGHGDVALELFVTDPALCPS